MTWTRKRPRLYLTIGVEALDKLEAMAEVLELPRSRVVELAVERLWESEQREDVADSAVRRGELAP